VKRRLYLEAWLLGGLMLGAAIEALLGLLR
jgi:hypothetical protein